MHGRDVAGRGLHGGSPTGGDMAGEQDAALAALLRPGRGDGRSTAGGTAIRSDLRPPAAPIVPAAWLPWTALIAGSAIGLGCIFFGLWIAPLLLGAIWPAGDMAAGWADALYTSAIFLPMLALTLAAGRLTGINPLQAGRARAAMIGLGTAMGAGGVALAVGYAGFAGVARAGVGGAGAGVAILAGSLLMLLQSGTEEALLRGWMQLAMARRWAPWAAVILTAAVFAGMHLPGGERSAVSLVNLALGGVMFGLLRWKSGGLFAPLAAHFAWNWSEALLLGLDPNPGIGSFGAFFDLDLVGPSIWGGSDEGLNASLSMTVVLAALIVPLALWKPRAGE